MKSSRPGIALRPLSRQTSPDLSVDWFLMLRMPEISTQQESGIETMKIRLDAWLGALEVEGFQPMRLSEVIRRLDRHEGLPERTLVVFFNPGYRRTYEIAGPIFQKHGFPVVWLTDRSALERSDRRYMTFHALGQLESIGWDAGFAARDTACLSGDDLSSPQATLSWSSTAGALALNRDGVEKGLNFLTVSSNWTASELTSRLFAEVPITTKVVLTAGAVQARDWGVSKNGRSRNPDMGFQLTAPAHMPGEKISWLGTLGIENAHLHARVGSLVGELWLQFRYDEASGNGLQIMLLDHDLVIEERRAGKYHRFLVSKQALSFKRRPFTLDVVLRGQTMVLTLDGIRRYFIETIAPPDKGKGILQFYLVDKMRGAATVDRVHFDFEPLGYKDG